MRAFGAIAVLALLSPLFVDSAEAQSRARLRTMCLDARPGSDAEAAINACTDAIGRGAFGTDAQLAAAYLQRGSFYAMGRRDYALAIADFDRALEIAPRFALAYMNRGTTYRLQGDAARAIADYNEAVRLEQNNAQLYVLRGYAHLEVENYPSAIADYDRAIRLGARRSDVFVNRGLAYSEQRDFTRAIADFDEAIRIDPTLAVAYSARGDAYYFGLQDYERALLSYDQAVERERGNAVYRNDACWTRVAHLGREFERALADCNEAVRLSGSRPAYLDSRGLVHLRMGSWEAAMADFDAALRKDPSLNSSLFGRGIARLRLGRTAEGQADIDDANNRDPAVATQFAAYGFTP